MNNKITVRQISIDEQDTALELVLRTFMQYEAPDYPPEGVDTFKKSVVDDMEYRRNLVMYGAFCKDTLLGVIASRNSGSHIALFFVDGNHHGQGIGRKLFEVILENCHDDKITVNSSPFAAEIYHHLGFTDTDTEQMTDGMRYIPMMFNVQK